MGKRYARTDELGVPFGITVDGQTAEDNTVTLRERDSTKQVKTSLRMSLKICVDCKLLAIGLSSHTGGGSIQLPHNDVRKLKWPVQLHHKCDSLIYRGVPCSQCSCSSGLSICFCLQIRVPIAELTPLLQQLSNEQLHWKDLNYPEVKASAE